MLAHVRVLPKDNSNSPFSVLTVLFDPIYYILPNKCILTSFGFHMTLKIHHKT